MCMIAHMCACVLVHVHTYAESAHIHRAASHYVVGCSLLHPSALYCAATFMIILLHSPQNNFLIFDPVCQKPVESVVAFGSIPIGMCHFLVRLTFLSPWLNVQCWMTRQLKASHQQRKTDRKHAEDFPSYGLWDVVFTASGRNSSRGAFHKFSCGAQHLSAADHAGQFPCILPGKEEHKFVLYITLKLLLCLKPDFATLKFTEGWAALHTCIYSWKCGQVGVHDTFSAYWHCCMVPLSRSEAPVPVQFEFDQNLMEDYSGPLKPAELELDDLTFEALHHR